jgi:hypothetical protein
VVVNGGERGERWTLDPCRLDTTDMPIDAIAGLRRFGSPASMRPYPGTACGLPPAAWRKTIEAT